MCEGCLSSDEMAGEIAGSYYQENLRRMRECEDLEHRAMVSVRDISLEDLRRKYAEITVEGEVENDKA